MMQAQEQLQAQGLYRGPIDGIMGSGTRRALAQFQRRNGLPPSGTLDQQTLASLSSGGIPGANSASSGTATPPTGNNAPVGTTAAPGAGTGAYNNQNFNNRQNTTAPPNGFSQPTTR
jgi:peptidoglycan hydrolase-like protein with peptidoglycan-binding domain